MEGLHSYGNIIINGEPQGRALVVDNCTDSPKVPLHFAILGCQQLKIDSGERNEVKSLVH